ncbi:MAG: acyltransferase [Thermodesulfobacteriota bacterium]
MLSFLPSPLKGILSFLIYLINTILLTVPLILVSLLKFILPFRPVVVILDRILMAIAGLWIHINSLTTDLFCNIDWDIRGLDKLNPREWYLVLSNHQSWVDILVLQKILHTKIPMLKFFLKKELIWVPFLGLAWWALDFPFMKRYSKQFLAQNPHLKGKDLESTRKACQKFKHTPVSIMNFVEGTRYTPEKAKTSAFSHLLTPRAGGIAFVLGSMGQCLNHIIDVTIVYPGRVPSFWSFISGKTRKIIVDFQLLEVGWHIKGDYFNDPVFRERFCEWLNQLWLDKDQKIDRLLS